jgi:hypothetical protein
MKFAEPRPFADPTTFEVGDRIKLSELGKSRSSKATTEYGVVAGIPRGGRSVRVLFDGNKEPTQLHTSYIEPM